MIHLGFGIEFEQPAIIAEALAQAALHDSYLLPFLSRAEEAATKSASHSPVAMTDIVEMIRSDEKLSVAAHWEDGNKLKDGILHRAPDEMTAYARLWTVDPNQLEYRTAEMVNTGGELSEVCKQDDMLIPKSSILRLHRIHENALNSTFISCTASTAQSSFGHSSDNHV